MVAPLVCNCPHSSNPSKNVEYRISPGLRFMSGMLCFLVILTLLANIQEYVTAEMSTVDQYLMVNDILLCVIATFLFVIAFILTPQKVVELQCMAEAVADAEKRGIIFLDEKFVKKNLNLLYIGAVFIGTLEVALTIRFLMQGKFDLPSVRFYVSDFLFFVQGFLAIHYHNVQVVFPSCFARLHKHVKFALTQRLDVSEMIEDADSRLTPEEESECLVYSSGRTFDEQMKELRRIYSSLVLCYKETEKFMNPSYIFFTIGAFASFTIKQVVLIKCVEYHIEFGITFILAIIRPYVFLATTTIWLILVEVVADAVSYCIIISIFVCRGMYIIVQG